MKRNFPILSQSSIQHLRIPFSFLLLPVYLMGLTMSTQFDLFNAIIIFVSLHFLLYPGVSGFNAFYDRDTVSICMLKNPPAVTPDLFWLSLGLKIAAVLTAFLAGPVIACSCFLYAIASILYSWDKVRLKKMPFVGWLLTGVGQGFITFMAVIITLPVNGFVVPTSTQLVIAVCMTFMILAASPLLEIFQHREDALRGDLTISRYTGVRGTLLLTGVLFIVSVTGFTYIFSTFFGIFFTVLFLVCLIPGLLLFMMLSAKVFFKGFVPDYNSVMPVSIAASTGMNCFCLVELLWRCFLR